MRKAEDCEEFDINGGRDGSSKEKAYVIDSAVRLAHLAKQVNEDKKYENTYFELTNDIGLIGDNPDSPHEWTPIGIGDIKADDNNENVFFGIFDGNGHTASFNITKCPVNYAGLFGRVKGGSIVNLNVAAAMTSKKNVQFMGGLVARQQGNGAGITAYVFDIQGTWRLKGAGGLTPAPKA